MAPAVRRAASDNVPVATKIPASKPQDNATDDNYVMINGRKYSKATPLPREETTNYDIINGDHGLDPAADLQDSLWTLTPEPHGLRRQEMIKELGKEVHKLQGYEPLTKYIVVVLMAMQCGMGYYLREEALYGGTLKFWLISYFFGAIMAQALFLAAHEISHNLAFKTLNANRWFGMFTNLPLVLPFFIAFKEYHNLHRKFFVSCLVYVFCGNKRIHDTLCEKWAYRPVYNVQMAKLMCVIQLIGRKITYIYRQVPRIRA